MTGTGQHLCQAITCRLQSIELNVNNAEVISTCDACAQARTVRYVGRPAAASPATASLAIHRAETAELIDAALAE